MRADSACAAGAAPLRTFRRQFKRFSGRESTETYMKDFIANVMQQARSLYRVIKRAVR